MTSEFNKFCAVFNIHVPAKFHPAACSGSWVIVLTEKKNFDGNNTVRRYRADSNNRLRCWFSCCFWSIFLSETNTSTSARTIVGGRQKQMTWAAALCGTRPSSENKETLVALLSDDDCWRWWLRLVSKQLNVTGSTGSTSVTLQWYTVANNRPQRTSYRKSVCPSVRPSRAGTDSRYRLRVFTLW